MELPSLTFQRGDLSQANLISTILFGDGAAAAVVTGRPARGPKILEVASHLLPDTIDAMGFDLQGDGFHIILSKEVPQLIRDRIKQILCTTLTRRGLTTADVSAFVLHPGGRALLQAVQDELGLTEEDTQPSWTVLRECGNQSSASVLFVLDEWLRTRAGAARAPTACWRRSVPASAPKPRSSSGTDARRRPSRAYLVVVAAVALLRFAELAVSARHRRALAADGARAGARAALQVDGAAAHRHPRRRGPRGRVRCAGRSCRRWPCPRWCCLVAATWTRWWVIQTLGQHWNVGVMDSTRQGVVDTGPYRWVRHPNYMAVFVELLALPLVHTAWITAVLGTVAHVFVLRARIAAEDRVLLANADYAARMGGKPRFFPTRRYRPPARPPPKARLTSSSSAAASPARRWRSRSARRGCAVRAVRAQTFPRDKPCGEGIMPAGVSALRRLGARRRCRRRAVSRRALSHGLARGGRPLSRRAPSTATAAARSGGWCSIGCSSSWRPRTPGVHAHQGVAVEGPVDRERPRRRGARRWRRASRAAGRRRRRRPFALPPSARAEPAGAALARRRAAPLPAAPGRTAPPWVDIFLGAAHEFYVTPLPAGEVLVALLAEAGAVSPPLEPIFDRWRCGAAALRELLEGAEPISDAARHAAGRRRAPGFAPGAVLLGDAAGFLDPITGGGIAQALDHVGAPRGVHRRPSRPEPPTRGCRRSSANVRRCSAITDCSRAACWGWRAARCWRAPRSPACRGLPSLFSHLVGVSAGTRSLTPPFRASRP